MYRIAVGGITPSFGLIKQVIDSLQISIYVLIRPRSGNFTYSDEAFDIMKLNIQLCKNLGCHGIVSGVLNLDNTIDLEKTQELVELSKPKPKPLPFTFHRAFNWVINPFETLDQLYGLGVERILISGQNTSAEKGIEQLIALKAKVKDRIIILPGGGINSNNATLFKEAGFAEIHASASTIKRVNNTPKIAMNSPKFFDETIEAYSDINKIKAILKAVNSEI